MLNHELLHDDEILVLNPEGPLEAADFTTLASQLDTYLEHHAKLRGVLIRAKSFPGWNDFGAMIAHLKFLNQHIQRIEKVAVVADGAVASIMPNIAKHFVHAQVRHFSFEREYEAWAWLRQNDNALASEAGSDTSLNELLYDRFAEKSREIFDLSQDKGRDAWEKAMELAHQKMAEAGEFSAEQGDVFKRYLRRDLDQTLADMQQLGEEAKEHLHPARLGAGALSSLAKLLHATGSALTKFSTKAEDALVYESGEITMAGSLTCLSCGHRIQLKKTSVVPACPACQATHFRKSY